jgi:SOS-response transcriptional repressor LexA
MTPTSYAEIYNFLVAYKTAHDGNSPSIREICEATGFASTSHVAYILTQLERHGKIKVTGVRQIAVVGGEWRKL